MSGLTEHFRSNFPRNMRDKYRVYWHAMHPVTYNAKKIYRAAFSNEEWKALKLLMERRSDAVSSSGEFKYVDPEKGIAMHIDMPNKYKGFPGVTTRAEDVGPVVRDELIEWYRTYCEHDNIDTHLHNYLRNLLKLNSEKRSSCGLNTPRQLHAAWPELLPFLNEGYRSTIRNTKVRPKLPQGWTERTLVGYLGEDHWEEINYALTVIPMLEDKIDKHYPYFI